MKLTLRPLTTLAGKPCISNKLTPGVVYTRNESDGLSTVDVSTGL